MAGIQWAHVEDAANAALHIACDDKLNGRSSFSRVFLSFICSLRINSHMTFPGRAIAVVPRATHPLGYMDLNRDDVNPEDILGQWQEQMIKASHRA